MGSPRTTVFKHGEGHYFSHLHEKIRQHHLLPDGATIDLEA